MTKERIEELIVKKSLTAAERAEVRSAADEAGIKYTVKQGCRTCYEQVLTRLYETLDVELATSKDGWKLKKANTSFVLWGKVYNNGNIAGVEVGKLHPIVRMTYFFKPIVEKHQDTEQDGESGEL